MKKLSILTLALILSACSAGVDYQKPQVSLPANWSQQTATPNLHAEWWKDFHDDTLNSLVDNTLANNQDRKVAEARLLESRALLMNANSKLYPEVNAAATAERGNPGIETQNHALNLYQPELDASYELDLFGGNHRQVEAQDAAIGVKEAAYKDVSISLVAEVVTEYANLRELQQRLILTQKTAEAQKSLYELSQTKFKYGTVGDLDVAQAESLYRATQSQIPVLQRDITAATWRLSVLTGDDSGKVKNLLAQFGDVPMVGSAPVLDAPADVITRRPDVAEAERTLASNTALTDVAISEMYPKITLSALFGFQNTTLMPSEALWGAAAGITAPVFNFGRIEGDIKAADARQQQAYHSYRQSVLKAVADVETKLSDYSQDKAHTIALNDTLSSSERALEAARIRYQQGVTPLIDTLDAENKVYAAQSQLITAQADEVRAVAALQKAAGV